MKKYDKESELSRKKIGLNPGKPLKRLYIRLFSLTTVFLLIIFLLLNNPYIVRGTITDKVTPTEPPQVDIQESLQLVDYYSDGMARQHLEYLTGVHGRLVIDPTFYEKKVPQRGDVVYYHIPNFDFKAFNPSLDPPESDVARVVALPGERIVISDGQIYINGKRLNTF
jgi:hypothetical protein